MKDELIVLNLHSAVDVITNSSTTIYTYEWGCEGPAQDLIDEVLRLQGSDKKWSDVVYMGVFCSVDDYIYRNHDWDVVSNAPESWNERRDWIESQIISVMKGEMDRPEWMSRVEDDDYGGDGYPPKSRLTILVKDEQYADLVKYIKSLVSGVDADGGYSG
jgi:hypothetical protein